PAKTVASADGPPIVPNPDVEEPPTPPWAPSPTVRRAAPVPRAARRGPLDAPRTPFESVPPPFAFPRLASVAYDTFVHGTALEVVWPDAERTGSEAHMLCVKDEAWRCAPPTRSDAYEFHENAYVNVAWLPAGRSEPRLALAHHATLQDGGSGEGSGAG